jgi:hypothetical protein
MSLSVTGMNTPGVYPRRQFGGLPDRDEGILRTNARRPWSPRLGSAPALSPEENMSFEGPVEFARSGDASPIERIAQSGELGSGFAGL